MMIKPPGDALDRTDFSVAATVLASAIIVFPVLTVGIQVLLDAAAFAAGR
jgi:hypothetical protein